MVRGKREHDGFLKEVIAEFRVRGWTVFNVSEKGIPDFIAVKGDNLHTLAGDVTICEEDAKLYIKKLKWKKHGFNTDDFLIISNNIPNEYPYPPQAYYYALELRKKGWSYKKIRLELKEKFDVAPSDSALSLWCNRKTKPRSVRRLEGIHRRNYK